jgi:amino acid transporter
MEPDHAEDVAPAPSLRRVIGVGGLTFLAINQIVGAGVAGLPGLVANLLGPEALVGYLLVAVLMALVGLCFAEVGSRVSGHGGLYAYAQASFGPVVAGIVGTLIWTANNIVPSAAVANLMVDTLAAASPVFSGPLARVLVICGVYAVFAAANVRGCRQGTGLSSLVACVKLLSLLALIAVALPSVHVVNLAWTGAPPAHKLGEAAILIFFAFMGLEGALNASGEVRNPSRTVPLAVVLALTLVAVLYIGLQGVAQGVLGARLAGSQAPLVDLASALGGPWAGRAVVLGVLVSTLGYLAADMVASPRTLFALAEQGQLPRFLASIQPKLGTPAVAIVVYVVATAAIACTGSFQPLVIVGSSGTLVLYLITCLGLLRLRARNVAMDGQPFRAPGGWLVPVAASAIIVWMLSSLTWQELAAVLALVAVSGAVYAVLDRRGRPPRLG